MAKPRPNETRGKPATGKIAAALRPGLRLHQMRDNREVLTARMSRKGPRSTTEVGEAVKFERSTTQSGARALRPAQQVAMM
jgi:hypothetical protein